MVETTKDAVKRIVKYSTIKRTIIYNDDTLKPCFGCIYGTHALCGDCVKHSESKFNALHLKGSHSVNALHIRKVDAEPTVICKQDGLCCDACKYMKAKGY